MKQPERGLIAAIKYAEFYISCTITEVSKDQKTITIQEDNNKENTYQATLRKDGNYKVKKHNWLVIPGINKKPDIMKLLNNL